MRWLWQTCRRHLKTLTLAVLGGLIVSALSKPVADINQESCDRIKPYMTGEEVAAIIGGPPGWYDGIGGVRVHDSRRGRKGEATWIGSRGQIVYGHHGTHGIVGEEEARYNRVEVLNRSWSLFVAERLTRNAFGATGSKATVDISFGATVALVVVVPVILLTKWLSNRRQDSIGVGLCAVGATLAALTCVYAGGTISDNPHWYYERELFQLLGAGVCGLVFFPAGIWQSLRRSRFRSTA